MATYSQGTIAKAFNFVLLFVQLAGFAIALAGIAMLQNNCNKNVTDYNFNSPLFGLGTNSVRFLVNQATSQAGNQSTGGLGWLNNTIYDCGMQYSWYWWVACFQAVCTAAGLLANFTSLSNGKLAIIAFYAIATAQWCIFAYPMVWEVYLYQAWSTDQLKHNKWSQGYCTAAAGAIVTLVANFLFLMIFGYDGASHNKVIPAAAPADKYDQHAHTVTAVYV